MEVLKYQAKEFGLYFSIEGVGILIMLLKKKDYKTDLSESVQFSQSFFS